MSDIWDEFTNDLAEDLKQAEYDRRGTTDKIVEYQAANGHLLAFYEDEKNPGRPGRACAWAAWHSENCGCGGAEELPDY